MHFYQDAQQVSMCVVQHQVPDKWILTKSSTFYVLFQVFHKNLIQLDNL